MQKLQAILAAKKGQPKVVHNKETIEKRQRQYQAQQHQTKKLQKERQKRKMEQYEEYYDQTRKMVKKNEQQNDKLPSKEELIQKLKEYGLTEGVENEDEKTLSERIKQFERSEKVKSEQKVVSFEELNHQRKLKQAEQYEELDAKFRSKLIEPRLMDDLTLRKRKTNMIVEQKEVKYVDICDCLHLWISKVLRDWSEALEHKYHSLEDKKLAKNSYARYGQTVNDMASFFKVLRARGGDQEMVTSIYHIMNCCLVREYIQANDKYIQLSIGNAPWPMGVAMLGITVRRNAQRLSHVLNEEMTRRWMQAIKRIISFSQEIYPNEDKLKMVGYSVNSMI